MSDPRIEGALANRECTCEHPVPRHAEGRLLGHPGKYPCTVFGCPCTDYTPSSEPPPQNTPDPREQL
jgi:hypothetical protein